MPHEGTALAGHELLASRRAFPEAQHLLAGAAQERLIDLVAFGWHGTDVSDESGAVAVARLGGPYEELVGEILRVVAGARSVYVYCWETAEVPTDLSLTRRAFAALGGLYLETLDAYVEITG